MANDPVPGAMTTQSVMGYNPQAAVDVPSKDVKVQDGAGIVPGRLEHLDVRKEHIAKEQYKQQLIAEGKIAEAERSRYV